MKKDSKSRDEIEKLKQDWQEDPMWDIEDTEGFEDYKEELIAFRQQCEAKRSQELAQKERETMEKMGCTGNIPLSQYLWDLQRRVEMLENLVDQLVLRA